MKIIVDADACPVIDEIIEVAEEVQMSVLLIRNFNHFTHRDYPPFVSIDYVDDGADSADYQIVARARPNDIVITQDYGLASLLLNKDVIVLHHNGILYTEDTIDYLLEMRHYTSQLRKAGQRTKGPSKFTHDDKMRFKAQLKKAIHE